MLVGGDLETSPTAGSTNKSSTNLVIDINDQIIKS